MDIGAPVVTTSLNGEIMRGRYLAHARTDQIEQPNRTDVANNVEKPRLFRATRSIGLILFLHNGRLFQQERNMAFVYPDFRLYKGEAVEGLDVINGQPLGIDTLIEKAMVEQRAASGGLDGTALEVEVAVAPPTKATKAAQA